MKSYDDPSIAWERYCEQAEQSYQYLIADKTCEDCGHCQIAEDGFFHDGSVAYCTDCYEFVHTFDTPLEYECGAFEER